METLEPSIEAQYSRGALQEAIWSAFREMDRPTDALTIDDLAPVDEYHIRGREATTELLEDVALDATTQVLDVGCGLGGTCRFVATTYGSSATGVDLSAEYCRVATALTERVGLADRVRILRGNALTLPVDDGTYDLAISQHVQMNIRDKRAYAREIARALKPGGKLALYEICAGEKTPVHYPVPWADDPSISFLTSPGELRTVLGSVGMEVIRWEDTTAEGLTWFERALERAEREGPPPLGLHLLMGADAKIKMKNVVTNLVEERIAIVMAVVQKA